MVFNTIKIIVYIKEILFGETRKCFVKKCNTYGDTVYTQMNGENTGTEIKFTEEKTMTTRESVIAVLSNEEFVENMKAVSSREELEELFRKNGVTGSMEEISEVVKEFAEAEGIIEADELDENALENVSGGFLSLLAVGAVTVAWTAFCAYGCVSTTVSGIRQILSK